MALFVHVQYFNEVALELFQKKSLSPALQMLCHERVTVSPLLSTQALSDHFNNYRVITQLVNIFVLW